MSKAEELAEKKYPVHSIRIVPARGGGYYADKHLREGFVEGYHQAEKDLKLTWEDIQLIVSIDWDLDHEGFSCGKSTEEYYKEVLKQFNEEKKRE